MLKTLLNQLVKEFMGLKTAGLFLAKLIILFRKSC